MCDLKNHNLVEVYRASEGYDIDNVVRWCKDCGAIVVDGEYDGRVRPGAVSAMMFPATVRNRE